MNLHRERQEETPRLVNQPKHWVILGNQWDDTSPGRMAFLSESYSEHSWGLSWGLHNSILLLIPVVTPNVTTHYMPPTLFKPQPLSTENLVYYLRKMKSSPFPVVSEKWVPLFFSPTWPLNPCFLLSSLSSIIPWVLSFIFIFAFLPLAHLRQRHVWVSLSKISLLLKWSLYSFSSHTSQE